MTTYSSHPPAMRTLQVLVLLGLTATAVAAASGLWFWIADPAAGTTLYDTLGPTAALSGLAAGVLFATSAIYAQIKGLWQYIPSWIRVAVMTLVVVGAIVSIVNWISTV